MKETRGALLLVLVWSFSVAVDASLLLGALVNKVHRVCVVKNDRKIIGSVMWRCFLGRWWCPMVCKMMDILDVETLQSLSSFAYRVVLLKGWC